jgi:uncharacterized protein (TIGR02594 family)
MIQPTLRLGSGYREASPHLREEVRELQRALVRWGYSSIIPDGELGSLTVQAVRDFQRKTGLEDDGIVGHRTWRVLTTREPRNVGAGFSRPPSSAPEPASKAKLLAQSAGGPAWMEVAKAEVGQHEVKGKAVNARIIEYHQATTLKSKSDEVAWCSSFVNWCFRKASVVGTGSAAAASWTHWGEASPTRYGAVAVIYNAGAANSSLSTSGNHVGFLVEETPTHFVILGGNQSNSVKVSNFPKRKWKLKACRWPGG